MVSVAGGFGPFANSTVMRKVSLGETSCADFAAIFTLPCSAIFSTNFASMIRSLTFVGTISSSGLNAREKGKLFAAYPARHGLLFALIVGRVLFLIGKLADIATKHSRIQFVFPSPLNWLFALQAKNSGLVGAEFRKALSAAKDTFLDLTCVAVENLVAIFADDVRHNKSLLTKGKLTVEGRGRFDVSGRTFQNGS